MEEEGRIGMKEAVRLRRQILYRQTRLSLIGNEQWAVHNVEQSNNDL